MEEDFLEESLCDESFEEHDDFNEYVESEESEEIEYEIMELKGNLLKFSKQKHRIKEIRNGAIVLAPDKTGQGKNQKHTAESKKRIADAVRARPKNARKGTSKKAQTFKQQLLKDYNGMKMSERNKQKLLNWFENNIDNLDFDNESCMKKLGIITDYQQQKFLYDEFGVDEILYSNDESQMSKFEDDLIEVLDYENLSKELEESIIWLKENKYSDEYIEEYTTNFWLDNGYRLDEDNKVVF